VGEAFLSSPDITTILNFGEIMSLLFFFLVKVIVKFIRKISLYKRIKVRRSGGKKKGGTFPAPHAGNGSKDYYF
jgi:hypothetical protein